MSDCWEVDSAGWCQAARQSQSPNHDARPKGTSVRLVVIHAISLPPDTFGGPEVEQFFHNALPLVGHPYFAQLAGVRVSAHFFIRRDGELVQFVSCNARAWHAGASQWAGHERCNDFSIGIELEGGDTHPFTTLQYQQLNRLVSTLQSHYPIEAIVGHSDIAPGRKTDPGPHFNWANLIRA